MNLLGFFVENRNIQLLEIIPAFSGAGYFQTPVRVGTDTEIVCVDIH